MVDQAEQSTEAVDLDPGDVFAGRYRIERLLGEGDRKKTYLAEDMKVGGWRVAVSIIKPNAVETDPDGTLREANLLARVGPHSHIVVFHDCNPPESPVQYLVFEYLPGGTLAETIENAATRGDRFPPTLVVRLGRQLAGALAHIHAAGVIHRDVAPQNMWLNTQGSKDKVKLGDFDSAVLLDEMPDRRPVTSDDYASPEEQAGDALDVRTDLYSLGGVLVSLARTELQFDEPQRLPEERPDFPPALVELFANLVAPKPDDRPASAVEVLDRLRQIDESLDLHSLISAGEGPRVEFKASMRYPRDKNKLPPPDLGPSQRAAAMKALYAMLEKGVVKTIAAFLNTDGGTLLIGVADDGVIVGIEDDFPTLPESLGKDLDGWQRNLKDNIISHLDAETWATLNLTIERTNNGTLARLDCVPRSQPTWLSFNAQQEFYIRAGAASEPLPPSQWAKYIKEHWLK